MTQAGSDECKFQVRTEQIRQMRATVQEVEACMAYCDSMKEIVEGVVVPCVEVVAFPQKIDENIHFYVKFCQEIHLFIDFFDCNDQTVC